MVTYRGYKTNVQYKAETSFGAGGTPPNTAIKGRISTVTLNKNNNLIRTTGLGDGRNEIFVGFGNFAVDWTMDYELADWDFLVHAIGPKSGSGTAVAPYYLEEADYVAYAGTSIPTFAMAISSDDVGGTDDVDTVTGCVINTVGLTLAVGQTLKCSLSGFGSTVTSSASGAAYTADTTKPWIFAQGNFKWNSSNVGRVTNASITINNNYDPEVGRAIGSRFIQAAELGLRKYDWTITVKMTDTIAATLRDHFYGQANTPNLGVASAEPTFYAIILNLSEGATSGLRNAQVLLENCSINDISKPVNISENIVELTINGAAKAGLTDTVKKPIKWWEVP